MSQYHEAQKELKSWLQEVELCNWRNPQELKAQFGSASIITGKRIVFNVCGNRFRLVVDIEFRLQIIFIVWFGTHTEYDTKDIKNIRYVKTNKK